MSERKPMILVFAGPNGFGKSTITQYFEKVGSYTNADDMVAATGMSNENAAKLADEKRYHSIACREDFTFETVLSSKYKLDMIKKAKSEGYFIKCVFVLTVDASINVARVAARVASGGHGVDENKIRSRYTKLLNNVSKLMELCDILHVFDNTLEPVRIIRKHKEDISIFPNEFWSEKQILDLINGTYNNI